MKKDYEFVYRTIRHKENNRTHYPAIKNLLNLFLRKWNHKSKSRVYDVYSKSLHSALRASKY